jgi:purine-binding chemotaxis protein CheW
MAGVFDSSPQHGRVLVCRAATVACAISLVDVVETMRPLPIVEISHGAPQFVLGLARVRGEATPVVALDRLLGHAGVASPSRFVVVRAGQRRIALAVDEVTTVRTLTASELAGLPPLLRSASSDFVAAVGDLDGELLLVLSSARLLPDELCTELEAKLP